MKKYSGNTDFQGSAGSRKRRGHPFKRLIKIIIFLLLAALLVKAGSLGYKGLKVYMVYKGYREFTPPSNSDYPVRGVDVSKWQGNIDWNKIAQAGNSFAFIKATEGVDYVDPFFEPNWDLIENSPMYAGAYHYFSFGSDGKKQAQNYINTVRVCENTLPPVVDFELTNEDEAVSKDKVKAELDDLLETLKQHYGTEPIIYTTPKAYIKYLSFGYSKYTLWMRNTYSEPISKWSFWQYDDEGRIENGYDGDQYYIDLNVYNGDMEKFRKQFDLTPKN